MKQNVKDLSNYLQDIKGYPQDALVINDYYYNSKHYPRIEVWHKGYIIQAFVILEESEKNSSEKFPFYRKYDQITPSGEPINPYCLVAYQQQDTWVFAPANDLDDKREVDYKRAVQAFNKRLKNLKGIRLSRTVKLISMLTVISVLAYLVLHILSLNKIIGAQIPLSSELVTVAILVAILVILPVLTPYINSLTIANYQIKFNDKEQNQKEREQKRTQR